MKKYIQNMSKSITNLLKRKLSKKEFDDLEAQKNNYIKEFRNYLENPNSTREDFFKLHCEYLGYEADPKELCNIDWQNMTLEKYEKLFEIGILKNV